MQQLEAAQADSHCSKVQHQEINHFEIAYEIGFVAMSATRATHQLEYLPTATATWLRCATNTEVSLAKLSPSIPQCRRSNNRLDKAYNFTQIQI